MAATFSFDDFIASTSFYSFLSQSKTARHIYENIICTEEMQHKMAEMSDKGKPAILASGPAIEEYCSAHAGECNLDLDEHKVRKAIGSMNAAALEPLGYTPDKNHVPLEKDVCEIFKSGTVFARRTNKQ